VHCIQGLDLPYEINTYIIPYKYYTLAISFYVNHVFWHFKMKVNMLVT